MRLVSLAPSNTELVAFLGLADQLVGVDDWSDWPPDLDAQGVARLGPDLQIDLNAVVACEPDLVLASLSVPGMERVVEGVRARGLEHVVLAPKRLHEVVGQALPLGERLGVAARGRALHEAMTGEIERVRSLTDGLAPVRVYWEWWPKPAITTGGKGWMSELLDAAGGTNVFADHVHESPSVDAASVAAREPDVLAACWCGSLQRAQTRERVLSRPEAWQAVRPVRDGRVLLFPEALFGRPGPRLVEGLRQLAATLHPELEGALGEPYAWLPNGAGGPIAALPDKEHPDRHRGNRAVERDVLGSP